MWRNITWRMGFIGKWEKYVANIVDLVRWEVRIPFQGINSNALFHYSKLCFYCISFDPVICVKKVTNKAEKKKTAKQFAIHRSLGFCTPPYRFKSTKSLCVILFSNSLLIALVSWKKKKIVVYVWVFSFELLPYVISSA